MKLRIVGENSEKGLTLVEIIAVITLIAIIATVVVKGVFGTAGIAKWKLNVAKMEKLKGTLEQYRLQYNSYPSKLDDLVKQSADLKESNVAYAPMATEDDLSDLWNSPFLYKSENNNRSFTLSSYGSDGVAGGEGEKADITLKP